MVAPLSMRLSPLAPAHTLEHVSHDTLIDDTRKLAIRRSYSNVELLDDHLREIRRRELYRELGFSTMAEFFRAEIRGVGRPSPAGRRHFSGNRV